jgi:hypothetical protein
LCTPAVLSETMRLALMLVATLAFASLAKGAGSLRRMEFACLSRRVGNGSRLPIQGR